MARDWKVDPARPADLGLLTNLAVGATQAHPGYWPKIFDEVGISPRNPSSNDYVGAVVTHPDADTFVFGVTFDDKRGGHTDEDMYKFDARTSEITPYMHDTFEKEYPMYVDHHRGAKPFLRP
jgi:hypothetical protein